MLTRGLNVLFFIVLSSSVFKVEAQSIIVRDSESKTAIPGCVITCSGIDSLWRYQFLTDTSGTLDLTPFEKCINSSVVIEVYMTAYLPFRDTVSTKSNLNIALIPSHESLDAVVVTGGYAPETTDNSIHKIRVISREQIEQQGAVTLNDALVSENNIRLNQDGVLGSSLSIMGVSGENIKIMIDGVPIIGRLDGSIDLSQISVSDIERIEIIEGPLSTVYGTNSLGGTINLITKKESAEKWLLQPGAFYESVGQYNASFLATYKTKKDRVSLSANRNYFDGWSVNEPYQFVPVETLADTGRFKTWKPKTQYTSRISYQRQIGKLLIRPHASYFYEEVLNRGMPRQPYLVTAFDDRYRTTRYDAGLGINGTIGKNHFINITSAYNTFERMKNTWRKDLTNLDEVLSNPSEQDTSSFYLVMSRGYISSNRDSANLNYQIGYDINYEIAEGRRIIDGRQDIGDYALFGSVNLVVMDQRLELQPGIRAAYNTDYRSPVVPSFNFKYNTGEWIIRGAYANGFRSPSLKELYFRFVDINHDIHGNDSLVAERSHNFQLGAEKRKINTKYVLKSDISLYYNHIYNQIALALRNNGLYQYVNVEEFISIGARANAKVVTNTMSLGIGLAYIGRQNNDSDVDGIEPFNYAPEINASLSYRIKPLNANVSLFYKYTGQLQIVRLDANDNIARGFIDDYHTLNASVSQNFWNKRVALTFGAKNILDVTNINTSISAGGAHSSGGSNLVAWGRSYFVSLKFNISGS